MRQVKKRIESWLKNKTKQAGAKGVVFGLSGGIDSAVVGVLAKNVFGRNAVALILPCHSGKEDIKDARNIAKKFKISVKEIDLSGAYDTLTKAFGVKKAKLLKKDLALGNVKPRLRMIALYYFANKNNYLVLGTGNKSELTMGYFTKYGDGGVDLLPLGDLLKSQVRELAYELGIPEKIIYKAPTAGLWKGQTDEGEMGIIYDDLDTVILGLERKNTKGINKKLINKVVSRNKKTKHKRQLPEIFEL